MNDREVKSALSYEAGLYREASRKQEERDVLWPEETEDENHASTRIHDLEST